MLIPTLAVAAPHNIVVVPCAVVGHRVESVCVGFVRLAVGEGIEKASDDFHAEAMKQAGLA